jgi:peptidoglycan/LPS O-acetylase OafA/YrhL
MRPDPRTLESWIAGGAVLAVLIVLHWLAYRVGERRRRRKALAQKAGQSAGGSNGRLMSNDPLIPE